MFIFKVDKVLKAMAVMESSIKPPKIQKKASKKNKKSWRKNTDLEEVEDFLEDQRLEERLGGAFDKRSDSDIFVVDKSSKTPGKLSHVLHDMLIFSTFLNFLGGTLVVK